MKTYAKHNDVDLDFCWCIACHDIRAKYGAKRALNLFWARYGTAMMILFGAVAFLLVGHADRELLIAGIIN